MGKWVDYRTTPEFIEFKKEAFKLLDDFPEELQQPLFDMAWETHHSHGYDQVMSGIQELHDWLYRPLQEYINRTIAETTIYY